VIEPPWLRPLYHLSRRGAAAGEVWRELYELPKEPLLIRATLLEGYIPAEREVLHWDGQLAWAAVEAWDLPTPMQEIAVVPLPLALLDVLDGPDGARLPLWAASNLQPVGQWRTDRRHWHKRYPADHADWARKVAASVNSGRWKDRRVPAQTVLVRELQAICIGHRETIEALLPLLTHVGKRTASGYGRVARWSVVPLPLSEAEAIERILANRPVPFASDARRGSLPLNGRIRPRCGWTPPYWYAPWHLPCIEEEDDTLRSGPQPPRAPAGEIDWFAPIVPEEQER